MNVTPAALSDGSGSATAASACWSASSASGGPGRCRTVRASTTASRVPGPKSPSTRRIDPTLLRSRWSALTASPESPCLSSMVSSLHAERFQQIGIHLVELVGPLHEPLELLYRLLRVGAVLTVDSEFPDVESLGLQRGLDLSRQLGCQDDGRDGCDDGDLCRRLILRVVLHLDRVLASVRRFWRRHPDGRLRQFLAYLGIRDERAGDLRDRVRRGSTLDKEV